MADRPKRGYTSDDFRAIPPPWEYFDGGGYSVSPRPPPPVAAPRATNEQAITVKILPEEVVSEAH